MFSQHYIWCNAKSNSWPSLYTIKVTMAHRHSISSNKWFYKLSRKYLARIERVIKMLSVGWELYQNYTILTFVVSFIPQLIHCYRDTEWKANKFPPLCSRPGITSTSWAAKTASTFKLSFQSVQPRKTSTTAGKSGRARHATPSLHLFPRQITFCSFYYLTGIVSSPSISAYTAVPKQLLTYHRCSSSSPL